MELLREEPAAIVATVPAADRAPTADDVRAETPGVMTVHGSAQRVARTAEEVHAVLRDAFNCGDIDALVAIYEDDATLLVPPGGRSAHGHHEIRAMMAPVLAARPHMTSHGRHDTRRGRLGAHSRPLGTHRRRRERHHARRPRHCGVPASGPTAPGASSSTTR